MLTLRSVVQGSFAVAVCGSAVFAVMVGGAGCATRSSGGGRLQAVTGATESQRSALLERVKSMAGEWVTTDEQGQKQLASVYTVSSNGSAVREVMFPGSSHEMTNMYTMDGGCLRVTHYCAIGNQPHMKACGVEGDRMKFTCDGVSNLTAADQMYMGELTLVFIDGDHVTQEWRSFKGNADAGHNTKIELTRRK